MIYLGSFAKSLFPGARVGFMVADQPVVAVLNVPVRADEKLLELSARDYGVINEGVRRIAALIADTRSCGQAPLGTQFPRRRGVNRPGTLVSEPPVIARAIELVGIALSEMRLP